MPSELHFGYHCEARFPTKKHNNVGRNFKHCQEKFVARATLFMMALTMPSELHFGYHFEARFPKKKTQQFRTQFQKLPTEIRRSRDAVHDGANDAF